ncbi:hypothetical protein BDV93DRAFT_151774 [Ceratobasidium sp. AG-I]|nr:hypothetical protein BDV93DRAFT_151774 [Ceratobasidium sp. AG-I]
MSTNSSSLALCRCGRTTALSDPNSRRALDCGHFICKDCWSYGQGEPVPWCDRCNIALYRNELYRQAERYDNLQKLHNQKMKLATDTIGKFKTFIPYNTQKNRGVPQADSPNTSIQPFPQAQGSLSSSAGPSTTTVAIDWNSEQGRVFLKLLQQSKELLVASQNENATLKSRVIDLTTQLEAKSQPDTEVITAIEKAELMEAELEGVRLDQCEEDLQKAQSELATAKANNEQLARDIATYRSTEASTEKTLEIYYNQFTELQAKCLKTENELSAAKQLLTAKGVVSQSFDELKAEWEHTPEAAVAQISREKAVTEKEVMRLTELLDTNEQENNHLRGKLVKSAELASELSRLHLAANERSEASEAKLILAQEELQGLRQHSTIQQKDYADVRSIADIAKYKSQVTTLEAKLAEATRIRENAVVQAKSWERNRDSWKRWGELMALRAQQAEEEAQKARAALAGEVDFGSGLQEPPPLTPFAMTPEPAFPKELGKTRKRPLEVPDTDVDGLHAIAQTSNDPVQVTGADSDGGSDRKKARLVQAP